MLILWIPLSILGTCFSKYAIFNGRASRSEFWFFFLLIWVIIWIPLSFLGGFDDFFLGLSFIYLLAIIMPFIAVWCRRMHDVDRSGWFSAVPVYSLILACTDSDLRDNRFGPVPKDRIKNFPKNYQRSYDELGSSVSSNSNKEKLIVCVQCSAKLNTGQNFCHMCGSKPPPLWQKICCSDCGTVIRENAIFCGDCGGRVAYEPPARSTPPFSNICGHCGYRLTIAQKFCVNCGRSRN